MMHLIIPVLVMLAVLAVAGRFLWWAFEHRSPQARLTAEVAAELDALEGPEASW